MGDRRLDLLYVHRPFPPSFLAADADVFHAQGLDVPPVEDIAPVHHRLAAVEATEIERLVLVVVALQDDSLDARKRGEIGRGQAARLDLDGRVERVMHDGMHAAPAKLLRQQEGTGETVLFYAAPVRQ